MAKSVQTPSDPDEAPKDDKGRSQRNYDDHYGDVEENLNEQLAQATPTDVLMTPTKVKERSCTDVDKAKSTITVKRDDGIVQRDNPCTFGDSPVTTPERARGKLYDINEPVSSDRRNLFADLSTASVPGNLHLSSDRAIARYVDRYGAVNVVRQLATDLAEREAEVGLMRRQTEDRERELKRMLVSLGLSMSEVEKRLLNMSSTSIRRPNAILDELMGEAMESEVGERESEHDNDHDRDPVISDDASQRSKRSWIDSLLGLREQRARNRSLSREDDQSSILSSLSSSSVLSPPPDSTTNHRSRGNTVSSIKDQILSSSSSSIQDKGPMELEDIVPQSIQPPTLRGQQMPGVLTDRYGFIYDRNKEKTERSLYQRILEEENLIGLASGEKQDKNLDLTPRAASFKVYTDRKGITITNGKNHHDKMTSHTIVGVTREQSTPTKLSSSRKTSSGSVKMLLAHLSDLHDGQQKQLTAKWDEFLNNKLDSRNIETGQLLGISGSGLVRGGLFKEFRDLVLGGVPIAYRPKIWGECSGAWTLKEPGTYEELVNRTDETEAMTQIDLDLYRTMPYNVFFGGKGPGITKLRRVLIAFSRRNPEVGYCQGMNLIAAILLLTYATEEDAFWSLVSMVENILPEGYFSSPLLTARAEQRVFRTYFKQYIPKLFDHLMSIGVEVEIITFDWFLSCFTDALPPEVLFRVWDVFLCVEGEIYLFKVALALFKIHDSELMAIKSASDLYSFMKSLITHPIQVETIIRSSNQFVIDLEEARQLRKRELAMITTDVTVSNNEPT